MFMYRNISIFGSNWYNHSCGRLCLRIITRKSLEAFEDEVLWADVKNILGGQNCKYDTAEESGGKACSKECYAKE